MGWLKGAIAAVAIAIGGTAVAGWIYYRPAFGSLSWDGTSQADSEESRVLYACNPDRAGLIVLPGAVDNAKAAIAREVTDQQQRELTLQILQELEQATDLRVGTSVGPRWLKQQEATIGRVIGKTIRQQLDSELQQSNPLAAALGNQLADTVIQPLVEQTTTQVISGASLVLQRNIDQACGFSTAPDTAPAGG